MQRRPLLTTGLVLAVTCTAFEALAVATTMPATVRDLGGIQYYGWAFTAFMLTNLVGVIVAGDEADRQGPARPFVVGVALFAVGLIASGLAPTMILVVAGRAVQGFGGGMLGSLAYVAIGRGFAEEDKARMLAILSSAWVIPGLIGPAIAGVVTQYVGWRWVFLGIAPLPVIAATLVVPAMRSLDQTVARPRDWRRAGIAAALAAGVGMAIASSTATSPVAQVALLLVGSAVAWRAALGILPEGTLRAASGLPAIVATAGLLNLGFFGVDAFVPLVSTAVRGQSVAFGGIPLTTATLGWTAGAWLQAHVNDRVSRRLLVLAGLGTLAAGVAGVATVLLPIVPVAVASVAWGVAGIGMGLAFSSISLSVLEAAPAGQEGNASSSLQLANVLGSALGTGFGGFVIAEITASGGTIARSLAIQDVVMLGVLGVAMLAATRMLHRQTAAPSYASAEPGGAT